MRGLMGSWGGRPGSQACPIEMSIPWAFRTWQRASLEREPLFLRREPFGDVKIGERLAGRDTVVLGSHVELLDITLAARLHGDLRSLVDADRPGGRKARIEPCFRRHGCAHAQVLHLTGADGCPAFVPAVCVHRDELHVHERALARLVELRVRHHGVVPIEHFAFRAGATR